MDSIDSGHNKGNLFFLHGHGGTGKTYLCNCIVSKVRSRGKIALVVASSGIAATLLPDGVTAHSHFKIPLDVDHSSTCSVKKGTALSELLKIATLIVWDEAPGPDYRPFGGKNVLLGGDFRQTLPVVTNGGREDSINAILPRSYLWNYCKLLQLSINMRISDQAINNAPIFDGLTFSQWVLSVGNGSLPTFNNHSSHNDWIKIPQCFLQKPTTELIQAIIAKVYLDFATSFSSVAYIKCRAIVTPTNAVVSKINDYLLDQIQGEAHTYFSADSLATTSSILLLRNLNPAVGLCNGTRILLTDLGNHLLRGIIVGGTMEGRQFPIRLCYAMTINKSQG
ncbi:ATP-dependent DNA helicase pif1 [Linum perenne]